MSDSAREHSLEPGSAGYAEVLNLAIKRDETPSPRSGRWPRDFLTSTSTRRCS